MYSVWLKSAKGPLSLDLSLFLGKRGLINLGWDRGSARHPHPLTTDSLSLAQKRAGVGTRVRNLPRGKGNQVSRLLEGDSPGSPRLRSAPMGCRSTPAAARQLSLYKWRYDVLNKSEPYHLENGGIHSTNLNPVTCMTVAASLGHQKFFLEILCNFGKQKFYIQLILLHSVHFPTMVK